MRVCFDVSSLPYSTGVSRYTYSLVQSLLTLFPQENWILTGSSFRQFNQLKEVVKALPPNFSPRLYPLPPRVMTLLFQSLNLPFNWVSGSVDLIHAWDWYTPTPGKAKLVSTVHDLALFKYPGVAHPYIKRQHQQSLNRLKQFQAHFIAVSQTTKQDLIDLFQIEADKISIIPEALPLESQIQPNAETVNQILTKFNLEKPYFLIVGTQEPRKNIPMQIDAWRHYQKDFNLVIAGKSGWEGIPPQKGLILLGQVTPLELAALYTKSQLLLYVSLYEGFGLPILEAFYHQIPVVTGNNSGMAEVAAGAGILADPQSLGSIIQAIGQALMKRNELVAKGGIRLNAFSWDVTARLTHHLYSTLT